MNADKQLSKITNQWLLMLLITLGTASAFYFWSKIRVDNIIPIEFSQNLSDFNSKIKPYFNHIEANTYYDFLFIIVYSILFYFTYRMFQSSMRIPLSKLGILLCLLPGVFDSIENILLLNLINDPDGAWLFNIFWLVVRAKWTLVIPFVIINFIIVTYYFIRFINSFFS